MKLTHGLPKVGAVGFFLLVPISVSYSAGDAELVSIDLDGGYSQEGGAWMGSGSICGNGRYVVFVGEASNLVLNDTNDAKDVFVRDRLLKTTWRVSVKSDGTQTQGGGNQHGYGTAISRDGRYVSFPSVATDLVPNDTNGMKDIFVHDNQTGQTIRASTTSAGTQANGHSDGGAFSADGRYLVFQSDATNLVPNDTNGVSDVFVKDFQTGTVRMVSVNNQEQIANGPSYAAAITGDARYVAFTSDATNLELGDTNMAEDVFVRDLIDGTTTRISMSSAGVQGESGSSDTSISDDGRYVVFSSAAANLVAEDTNGGGDVFVRDRQTGKTKRISFFPAYGSWGGGSGRIDASGRMIVFNAGGCYLLCDQLAGSIENFNCASGLGNGYNPPAISADGTVIGFGVEMMLSEQSWVYQCRPTAQMKTFAFNRTTVAGQNKFTATLELFAPAGPLGATFELSSSSSVLQVPATLTIGDGLSSRTFMVKSLPVETARVYSATVQWGSQSLTATITLVPLKPSAFQFTPNAVIGGNPVSARLVMNGVAGSGGQVVNLYDNSSFSTTPTSVTVPPNGTQAIFAIQTLPVTATKYVTVTASAPQGFKTGNFVIRVAPPARGF